MPPRAECLLSNPSLSELFFLISIHASILEGFIGQAPSPFLPSFPGVIHSSSHEGVNEQAPSPFFQSPLGSSGCALALLSAPSLAAAYIQTFRHSRIFWPSPSPALFSQSVFTPLKLRPRPPPAFRPRLNQRNLPVLISGLQTPVLSDCPCMLQVQPPEPKHSVCQAYLCRRQSGPEIPRPRAPGPSPLSCPVA